MALLQQTTLQKRQEIQRQERFQKIWKPLISVLFTLAIGYFLYHSISGEHGIGTLMKLNKEVQRNQKALDHARAERLALERKVEMLREDSLNKDMLDEQVRRVLGYVSKDETIYMIDQSEEIQEE